MMSEYEKSMLKKMRLERDMQEKQDRDRLKKAKLEAERKKAYEKMIEDIQMKICMQEKNNEYMKQRVENQQKSKELFKQRKQEYYEIQAQQNIQRDLKRAESDLKIRERRELINAQIQKAKESYKEKRQWREYRHLKALQLAEDQRKTAFFWFE